MHLLIRRSQRDDGWLWSAVMFELDARLELAPEELHLFEKYDLHRLVVYDSDPRVQHAYLADEHFEAATRPMTPIPWEPSATDVATVFGDIAASCWHTAAGTAQGIMSHLSLSITLGSLIEGQHFESDDMLEILTAESNIREAAEYLASHFKLALTFDGSEDLSEF